MIEVYNSLLDLAHSRLDELTSSREKRPAHMPKKSDVLDAMSRMMQDRYAIPNPISDPVLRCCMLRILEINSLVLSHALVSRRSAAVSLVGVGGGSVLVEEMVDDNLTAGDFDSWPRPISGEIPCPECRYGSLCYLIGREGGAFVECSTVDCLYWDSRR
jgi:hypothetical protein